MKLEGLKKWLNDGFKLSKSLVHIHKVNFAKRLKKLGVELLYGTNDLPVSVRFKGDLKPIKKDSRLWEVLRHIDLETWNKA